MSSTQPSGILPALFLLRTLTNVLLFCPINRLPLSASLPSRTVTIFVSFSKGFFTADTPTTILPTCFLSLCFFLIWPLASPSCFKVTQLLSAPGRLHCSSSERETHIPPMCLCVGGYTIAFKHVCSIYRCGFFFCQ